MAGPADGPGRSTLAKETERSRLQDGLRARISELDWEVAERASRREVDSEAPRSSFGDSRMGVATVEGLSGKVSRLGTELDRRRQRRAASAGDAGSSTRSRGKADRAFVPMATTTSQFEKENAPNPSSNRPGHVGKPSATRGTSSRGKKANRVQAVQAAGGRKALANQLKRRFGGSIQQ